MQIKGSNNRLALRALLGARASRRAWRTSTPSWAARRCASSSAAGGRRTPRSQRGRAGDPDKRGRGVSTDLESHLHLAFWCIAFGVALVASISYTLISPHSFWKLECRPRTLAGPGPAGGLLADRAHLGLRQEQLAEEGEQAPAVEEGCGSAARGTRDARSAIDTAQTKDTRKTLSGSATLKSLGDMSGTYLLDPFFI